MTIEQLRDFLIVGKYLNIAKAAEHLYVSHSSLSRRISSLEKSLGVQLLERDNRSVHLTPAGKYVCEHGPELMHAIEEFKRSVSRIGSEHSGKVTVCMPNISSKPLYDSFREFRIQYPDIQLELNVVNVNDIADKVLQNEADVGITYSYHAPKDNPYLETIRLFGDNFCLVVSDKHPLAGRSSIAANELPDDELAPTELGLKTWLESDEVDLVGGDDQDPSQISLDNLLMRIRAGMGIAIIPRSLMGKSYPGCSILDITTPKSQEAFGVVLLVAKKRTNPAVDLLLNLITEHDFRRNEPI